MNNWEDLEIQNALTNADISEKILELRKQALERDPHSKSKKAEVARAHSQAFMDRKRVNDMIAERKAASND